MADSIISKNDNFPKFDWSILLKENADGTGTAIFEATAIDFVMYKTTIDDNVVEKISKGLFKTAKVLVSNTTNLIKNENPHSFLTLKKLLLAGVLKLKFTAEILETSFEINLQEVEQNAIELLTKRIQRLEEKQQYCRLVYESTTNGNTQLVNGQKVQWNQPLFVDEDVVTHNPGSLVLKIGGKYQIIVSITGTNSANGSYNRILVNEKEILRSYTSDNTNYSKQSHMMCFYDINVGETVSVVACFNGNPQGDALANRFTIIKY